MKSEISTILIQRNQEILNNIDAAMVYLDTEVYHIPGQLVMIRYYTDSLKTNVDTLFAVGVKYKDPNNNSDERAGYGRNYYSIISTSELYVVYDVLDDPVDVSELVHDQRFLCKVDGVWKIELISADGKSRTFIDVPKDPYIFRNLADGLQYYYRDGELKREDDFVTSESLSEELKIVEENVDPPTISLFEVIRDETYSEGEGNVYPEGASLADLQFRLIISDYKDEDITGQFTVELYKNGLLENLNVIDDNTYSIAETIYNTSTYEVRATKDNYVLRKEFTIYIVSPTYYGKMSEFNVQGVIGLSKDWWNGNGDFEFTENLVNEITVMAIPVELKQRNFTSIKDTHGLNYINDYDVTNYIIYGVNYRIYYKKDQVTINNFKQTFGYE